MLAHRMHAESRLVTCESKGLQLPAAGNLTTLLALRPVTSLLSSARSSGWDRFRAEAQGEMFSGVTRVAASGGGDRRPDPPVWTHRSTACASVGKYTRRQLYRYFQKQAAVPVRVLTGTAYQNYMLL